MGRLMKLALVLCVAVIVATCLGLWAQAATFTGNQVYCENLSNNALSTADMRNAGIPWKVFKDWLQPQLDAALVDEGSFVKSQEDVAYILTMFKRIFDEPALSGVEFKHIIYQDCMKTAAKQ